jgi:hypothetical protein
MKMPEPTIEQTTSAVEEKRPRPCTILGALAGASEGELGLETGIVT